MNREVVLPIFTRMFGGKCSVCQTQPSSILLTTIRVCLLYFSWFLLCWVKQEYLSSSHFKSDLTQLLWNFNISLSADSALYSQGWLAPQLERRSSTTLVWRSQRTSSSPWWPALVSPIPRRLMRACLPTWCADCKTFLRGWRTGCN